jgi:citrate lyase subunit beta/citryl-CoA lyase
MTEAIVCTALYVPGDRPDRFGKAQSSGADVVVIDLEDAVAPSAKDAARAAAVDWIAAQPDCPVQVRVNAVDTPWFAADAAALRAVAGRFDVRLPKAESGADLDAVVGALGAGVALHVLVETARGVESIVEIAGHPATVSICLGESDLRSELGFEGDVGLAWVRSRLVIAARAAGLPAPLMSVWPDVLDLDGLARSCATGRALGLFGRAVIHPRQIPVVVEAFRPSAQDLDRARAVVEALEAALAAGRGVATLPSGGMVDAAMRPAAERLLAIEKALQDNASRRSS